MAPDFPDIVIKWRVNSCDPPRLYNSQLCFKNSQVLREQHEWGQDWLSDSPITTYPVLTMLFLTYEGDVWDLGYQAHGSSPVWVIRLNESSRSAVNSNSVTFQHSKVKTFASWWFILTLRISLISQFDYLWSRKRFALAFFGMLTAGIRLIAAQVQPACLSLSPGRFNMNDSTICWYYDDYYFSELTDGTCLCPSSDTQEQKTCMVLCG